MPTLNDSLGGLVASATEARAMQVAEQYAQHELLRHFPVPRMRIGDIVPTIPVAVEGLSERKDDQLAPNGNAEFQEVIAREPPQHIDCRALPAAAAQKFQSALADRIPAPGNGIREAGERDKPMWTCIDALGHGLCTLGLHEATQPSEERLVHVAIVCNTGRFRPSRGLRQGHFDGHRHYGEAVLAWLQLSKSIAHAEGVT